MVTLPALRNVTTPVSDTVAMVLSLDSNARFLFVALSGLTLTVSVSLSPTVAAVGLFCMETEVTATSVTFLLTVTVKLSFLDASSLEEAVMVTVPSDRKVTFPSALTAATVGSLEENATLLSVASAGKTFAVRSSLSPT